MRPWPGIASGTRPGRVRERVPGTPDPAPTAGPAPPAVPAGPAEPPGGAAAGLPALPALPAACPPRPRGRRPGAHDGGAAGDHDARHGRHHQHDGVPAPRERAGPEPGEPPAPPARAVRQHGARDLLGPRDGVPAEGAAGQPLRAARPALHGQERDALAPALPGTARNRRQEPPRAGAQLRGHRHVRQPDGLPGGDGLPHGPRVRGQRARVPQGHHEDRGVQDLPHTDARKHGEH